MQIVSITEHKLYFSITELPVVSKSLICQQFKDFLSQTDPYDLVHDVILHVSFSLYFSNWKIVSSENNLQ